MEGPILVVGAGIGGLACAAALRKVGFEVRVFERASELGEVGAGLGLWTNAIRALRTIGIDGGFFARHGCPVRAGEAGTSDGRVVSRFSVARLAEAYGAPSYVVHRADLHRVLADAVDPARVTLGAECVGVASDDDGVTVRFADGTEARGAIAIGADGLRSAVRASLFGDEPPRYAGETCYRGIAAHAVDDLHTLREVQGRGLRCAVCVLGPDRVYWWATHRAPEGETDDPRTRKSRLASLFDGFAFGFPEALAATEPDAILRNDLYDRPPTTTWHAGRAVLIGDAAHPTTPNLGQGACMAIEDAVVLARCLVEHEPDPGAAFRAFEAERTERCARIVEQSRTVGRVGTWSNPLAVAVRTMAFRLMPDAMMERAMREHLGYDAGPLPARA
ncbi:MAG TPA: FAD-dependent monooxygenase [Sandaracinaceae bacterium LLY-WYZ-13_1]|nr:FAD-dependent monooxygenase [Sandaracinaceae bacterium LLY-WYZ-13_1]